MDGHALSIPGRAGPHRGGRDDRFCSRTFKTGASLDATRRNGMALSVAAGAAPAGWPIRQRSLAVQPGYFATVVAFAVSSLPRPPYAAEFGGRRGADLAAHPRAGAFQLANYCACAARLGGRGAAPLPAGAGECEVYR